MKQVSLSSWFLIFALLLAFLVLVGCSNHYVKLGKRCTKVALDNTYEKSLIWIVNKESVLGKYINSKWQNVTGLAILLITLFLGLKSLLKVFEIL